jgi:hypothetical protein
MSQTPKQNTASPERVNYQNKTLFPSLERTTTRCGGPGAATSLLLYEYRLFVIVSMYFINRLIFINKLYLCFTLILILLLLIDLDLYG